MLDYAVGSQKGHPHSRRIWEAIHETAFRWGGALLSSTGPKRVRKLRPADRSVVGLGFEFAAGVGGMSLVGYWIGGYYGNAKLGLVIGASLGLIGSMYNVVRVSMRLSKGRRRESKDEKQN